MHHLNKPVAAICLAVASAFVQAQQATYDFNIPAQPASQVLDALSKQTGLQPFFAEGAVKGVQSPGVKGKLSLRDALDKALAGTGLTYQFTGEKAVAIKAAPAEKVTELAAIEVKGASDGGYAVKRATTATKTDTPLLETPMAVQVVPREIIDDQKAYKLDDVMKNVSGISQGFGFGNLEDTYIIRGFEASTNNWGLTQIYRDGSLAVGSRFSMADVERVEVIKGPAAMLYGRLEPGGLINVVTKRPQAEPEYYVQQEIGSYDHYRTTAGATGALTKDGSLTYRLDMEYLDQNSFRDHTFNKQTFISPKLNWRISNNTQLDFEYQYFDQTTVIDWGVPAVGSRPAAIPISRFLGEPSDRFPHNTQTISLGINHNINDHWKVQAKYFGNKDKYQTDKSRNHAPVSLNEATGVLTRRSTAVPHIYDSDFFTVNVNGKFNTAGLNHDLLMGVDYFDSYFTEDGTSFRTPAQGVGSINIYSPVYGNGRYDTAYQPMNSFVEILDKWHGVYIQDQIKLNPQWQALIGARYDWAESKSSFNAERLTNIGGNPKDSELSSRFGLLYQPEKWLSVYASYVEGFNGAVTGRLVDNSNTKPNRSHQYELGAKGEFLDGKLTSSIAIYELTKENLPAPHPDPVMSAQGYIQQTGEARSRGLEFDVQGRISNNWSVIGSYTYTDAKVTKDNDGNGGPRNMGHWLHSTPRHAGSLWIQHQLGSYGLSGLSAGAGIYLVGKRYGDLANSYELPGYARVDIGIKYVMPASGNKTTLGLNIRNLFDKEYYPTSRPNRVGVTPGEPLSVVASIRYDF